MGLRRIVLPRTVNGFGTRDDHHVPVGGPAVPPTAVIMQKYWPCRMTFGPSGANPSTTQSSGIAPRIVDMLDRAVGLQAIVGQAHTIAAA